MPTPPPAAKTIDRNRYASTYTEKSFPTVLGPHSIMLNFSSYTSDKRGTIKAEPGITSIALPIPTNLVDTFQMKVGSTDLGAVGKAAQTGAFNLQDKALAYFNGASASDLLGGINTKSAINNGVQAATVIAQKMGLGLGKNIIEGLGGDAILKGIGSGLGATTNPFVALTFDGIDLKSHQFDWTLAPESAADSANLQTIINLIKRSVTPGYKFGQRAYLSYPDVVDIFFIGSEEGYMYSFKRCMVNSFSANYAGGGAAAFVEGGRPAVVTLSMALTEMEIWTTGDFGGEGNGNDKVVEDGIEYAGNWTAQQLSGLGKTSNPHSR